jgi:hypothetical protein
MLLERQRQLLTAFVDGELNTRQRRHVARLLSRSEEARQLLQKLRADAQALQSLPSPHLTGDLTDEILRKIKERGLTTGKRPLSKAARATFWSGPFGAWTAAAAVLLTLGLASYLYFAATLAPSGKSEVAKKSPETTAKPSPRDEPKTTAIAKATAPSANTTQKATTKLDPAPPRIRPMMKVRPGVAPKQTGPNKSADPPKEESVLTDRMEMFQYNKVETDLPFVLKVRDLDQEGERKKLIAELRKDANYRLELPCQNGTHAFERVQAAAKAMNLSLVIEKRAQDRLKLSTLKTNYVVYIENIAPEELAHLVRQIGAEDKKTGSGKPAHPPIDRLVLTRMTPQHHKELATLMGIDPTESAPNPKGPLSADPRKPLSDLTAQQVGKALAGQGGTPRTEAGKPPQLQALVLPYNPVRPQPGSPEIKRFLENRKPAKPGTIRVLLVLRS